MPSQRDNSERRHQNNASERRPQNLPPPVIFYLFLFWLFNYFSSLIHSYNFKFNLISKFNFDELQQSMSDTSSTGSPPAVHRNNKNSAYDLTDVPDFQQPHVRPCKII